MKFVSEEKQNNHLNFKLPTFINHDATQILKKHGTLLDEIIYSYMKQILLITEYG